MSHWSERLQMTPRAWYGPDDTLAIVAPERKDAMTPAQLEVLKARVIANAKPVTGCLVCGMKIGVIAAEMASGAMRSVHQSTTLVDMGMDNTICDGCYKLMGTDGKAASDFATALVYTALAWALGVEVWEEQ